MLKRFILSIELIFLCGPAVVLLGLGFIYLPASLLGAASGKGDWHIGLMLTLCGAWGLISLANLAWYTFGKRCSWPGKPIQWAGIVIGFFSCIIGLVTFGERPIMLFVFAGPLIATAHLLYLTKKWSVVS